MHTCKLAVIQVTRCSSSLPLLLFGTHYMAIPVFFTELQ